MRGGREEEERMLLSMVLQNAFTHTCMDAGQEICLRARHANNSCLVNGRLCTVSGKRNIVHCPCEPTALWLIASYVVVKLASVITENCSVRFSWSHVGRGCASPSLLLKREIIANAKHDRLQQLYMHIERKHFIMILSGITNATTSCTIHL